jgi:hypothetical protein
MLVLDCSSMCQHMSIKLIYIIYLDVPLAVLCQMGGEGREISPVCFRCTCYFSIVQYYVLWALHIIATILWRIFMNSAHFPLISQCRVKPMCNLNAHNPLTLDNCTHVHTTFCHLYKLSVSKVIDCGVKDHVPVPSRNKGNVHGA